MNRVTRGGNKVDSVIALHSIAWYKKYPNLAKMSDGQFKDIIENCLNYGAQLQNIYFENSPLNQTALIVGDILNPKMDNIAIELTSDTVYLSKNQGVCYTNADYSKGFLVKRCPGSFLIDVIYRPISGVLEMVPAVTGANPTPATSGYLVDNRTTLNEALEQMEELTNVLN